MVTIAGQECPFRLHLEAESELIALLSQEENLKNGRMAVENELAKARVAFQKRHQELEATQSQLDRQDPELQRMRRQVQALDQRVNDLTDELDAAEDEFEKLEE